MALILLVDDSHLGRTLARLTLTRAGHRVIEARDGREGLDLGVAHGPDLIVAAASMPALDGVSMVSILRQRGLNAPVVLVGSGPGWLGQSEGAEVDAVAIPRSVEPHRLTTAVQAALSGRVARAA